MAQGGWTPGNWPQSLIRGLAYVGFGPGHTEVYAMTWATKRVRWIPGEMRSAFPHDVRCWATRSNTLQPAALCGGLKPRELRFLRLQHRPITDGARAGEGEHWRNLSQGALPQFDGTSGGPAPAAQAAGPFFVLKLQGPSRDIFCLVAASICRHVCPSSEEFFPDHWTGCMQAQRPPIPRSPDRL